MASFDTINYSLRPNKAIQRHIVFDGLDIIDRAVPISKSVYIGFGSIWFSDFIWAHKRMGLVDLISIERDPVGASRARFNAPYRTVTVEEGDSTPVLRDLAAREQIAEKSWIAWLDYDRSISTEVLEDVDIILTHAPQNSNLIVTLDAGGLGKSAAKRRDYVLDLVGDAFPDDLDVVDFEKERMPRTLGVCMTSYMRARAADIGRPGGFVPSFLIPYRDTSPMVTIGGILPSAGARGAALHCVESEDWIGFPTVPVDAPALTLKEVSALQRLLPSGRKVTRASLKKVGFDLLEGQLLSYVEHYRRYPTFMQVVS